jgi:hypothetical protein
MLWFARMVAPLIQDSKPQFTILPMVVKTRRRFAEFAEYS